MTTESVSSQTGSGTRPKASAPACVPHFEAELADLTGASFADLCRAHATTLAREPAFSEVHMVYHRILAGLGGDGVDGFAAPLSPAQLAEARATFGKYCQAWLLRSAGHEPDAIATQLNDKRVQRWLVEETVPNAIALSDPEYRESRFIQFQAPLLHSEEFAYVLGAVAAFVTPRSQFKQVNFNARDRGISDRISDSLLRLGVREPSPAGEPPSTGASNFGITTVPFLSALQEITQSNTRVPWEHVLTGEERRAFLTGFFDFTNAKILPKYGRFIIVKEGNEGLIRDLAILLKREGIHVRFKGGPSPQISVVDTHEFRKLEKLGVIRGEAMAAALHEVCTAESSSTYYGVEDYFRYLSVRAELEERHSRKPLPSEIREVLLARDDTFDVPAYVIAWWSSGKPPRSFERFTLVAEAEKSQLAASRPAVVGARIIHRIKAEHGGLTPTYVAKSIVEFYGGTSATLRTLNISRASALERLLDGREFNQGIYAQLLAAVDAKLEGEMLEAIAAVDAKLEGEMLEAIAAPTPDRALSWLSSPSHRTIFDLYRGSIMVALQEAHRQGRSPREALLAKIAKLQGRSEEYERSAKEG